MGIFVKNYKAFYFQEAYLVFSKQAAKLFKIAK